MHLSGAGEAG